MGGVETHVQALVRGQADRGADVRVVCVNHRDRHGRDVTWEPFAVTPTVEDRDGPVRLTRLGRSASLARLDVCTGLPGLLRQLLPCSVDLVHLHVPNPTMLLALAALPPRVPLVITHHSDVVRQRLLGLAQRPFEHLVYRRAVRILTTSPHYADGSALLQSYTAKLDVLPFGVDLTPYQTPSPAALAHAWRLRAELGQPLWLCVGRLVYYKGLANAIEALPQLPGKLLVIGEGPLEGGLRQLAAQRGVAERVVWRGSVAADELVGAYQAATALWFPSNARSEGFGLVQVEAMASGCPVINTAIAGSGVSWVSRHDETGLTVPVNDPAALAAAAQRLLDEPDLRPRLAAAAQLRARKFFGQAGMARRSLEIYDEVLAPHGRNGNGPNDSGLGGALYQPARQRETHARSASGGR
jgi:rhamnosyl/mannosyltransferase